MSFRNRNLPLAIAALALGAWCAGCSVKRVPTTDPAKPATGGGPYDFQGEAKSPPAPATTRGSSADPPGSLETPAPAQLDAPAVAVEDLPATPPGSSGVAAPAGDPQPGGVSGSGSGSSTPSDSGYRVQIFAGTDAAAAERVRQEAESRSGSKAYVVFQAPYYKVRVGDCASNDGCRDLQARLRDAGYDTVWIVPDAITP